MGPHPVYFYPEKDRKLKKQKTRTLNGAFWRFLKRYFGSWRNFEIKDANWSVLSLFKTMFLKLKLLRKMKIKPLYVAFWYNLNRSFGSWNCWEHLEIEDAKRSILTLFETMFLFFISLIKYLSMPDPPFTHIFVAFSHLKVRRYFDFQFKSLLERVNEYATLRACMDRI